MLAHQRIVVAAMVDTTCGMATAVGAAGLAAGLAWGRAGALGGRRVALAGTTLGIVANAFAPGSAQNDACRRIVVVALLVGPAPPWRPGVNRAAAGGAIRSDRDRAIPARIGRVAAIGENRHEARIACR